MSLKPLALYKLNIIDHPNDKGCKDFAVLVEDTDTKQKHLCRSDAKGKVLSEEFVENRVSITGSNIPSLIHMQNSSEWSLYATLQYDYLIMTKSKRNEYGVQSTRYWTPSLKKAESVQEANSAKKQAEEHTTTLRYPIDDKVIAEKMKFFAKDHGFKPSSYEDFRKSAPKGELGRDYRVSKPVKRIDNNKDGIDDWMGEFLIYEDRGRLRTDEADENVDYVKDAAIFSLKIFGMDSKSNKKIPVKKTAPISTPPIAAPAVAAPSAKVPAAPTPLPYTPTVVRAQNGQSAVQLSQFLGQFKATNGRACTADELLKLDQPAGVKELLRAAQQHQKAKESALIKANITINVPNDWK